MARLYLEIRGCDEVLGNMENMLSTFQANLSSISSEIDYLQEASTSMSQKLRNRQEVSSELEQVIEKLAVSEVMINTIIDTPVQEQSFSNALQDLSKKIDYLKELDFLGALAVEDVRKVIEKLRLKAVSKIREFIFDKIYQFRKPMTNYQVPQNALVKFKNFNEFLMAHSRETAMQVRDEYLGTVSKVYFSYFKDYQSRIQKLEFEGKSTKDDVIAGEESGNKRGSNLFGSNKHNLTNKSTVFTLGSRDEILTTKFEDPMIIPHAQKQEKRFTYETIFRSTHYSLTDTCSREFIFLQEFFQLGKGTQDLFNSLLERTLSYLYNNTESGVSSSYDSIGLLLCINLIHRYHDLMEKRGVPALTAYWGRLLELLWPRFLFIIELNVNSIRSADSQKLSHFDHTSSLRHQEVCGVLSRDS